MPVTPAPSAPADASSTAGTSGGDKTSAFRRLADAFDPRNNSLNALRLFFAFLVIVGHPSRLGFGHEARSFFGFVPQELAVDGFFVISGYLITRSRLSGGTTLSYLRKRFLRIFPGYWACLLMGAFVFGPIVWQHEHHSLAGYFSSTPNPLLYVGTNITLFVHQYGIGGLLDESFAKGSLNGSLWTLFHEFAVYLLIAALAIVGLLRKHSRIMPVITFGYFLGLLWFTLDAKGFAAALHSPVLAGDAVRLGFMFAVGACLFLWADKVPFHRWVAVGAFVVLALSGFLSEWRLLGALPFAYLVMWLAIQLPLQRIGSRHDLSYGVYLYGWPSQVLLAMWGVPDWGYVPYTALSLVLASAFALASWNFVESPAMRLKNPRTHRAMEPRLRSSALQGTEPPAP